MSFEAGPRKILERQRTVEVPAEIPALSIHETSPVLDEEASNILHQQWERFWQLRSAKHDRLGSEATGTLRSGELLHNLRYDENALATILKSGIISGELGDGEKETRAEDAETHYCADFFVNQTDQSIKEYIEYAYGDEENTGRIRKKRIESFACPREQNDYVAIAINPDQPQLASLLQDSATGIDTSALNGFPVRFPYGADKPEIAKRHLAILVGVPANYISSLVVGGKLATDQERLSKVKQFISAAGLEIPIFDWKGERL